MRFKDVICITSAPEWNQWTARKQGQIHHARGGRERQGCHPLQIILETHERERYPSWHAACAA